MEIQPNKLNYLSLFEKSERCFLTFQKKKKNYTFGVGGCLGGAIDIPLYWLVNRDPYIGLL